MYYAWTTIEYRSKLCTDWQMDQYVRRKPRRPRKNWIDIICQDLRTIGMVWKKAEESAADRENWRRGVAQFVCDTG